MTIYCESCNIPQERVWPIGNGVCDRCLVNNFALEEALAATCSSLHDEIRRLYLERSGEKKSPTPDVEYSGPHFGNSPLPDEDW